MAKKNIIDIQSNNNEYHLVIDPADVIIQAVKDSKSHPESKKVRLYLDVDGTLVAMIFNPDFMSMKDCKWDSVHRTDFCHWINSISSVLDQYCDVYVLTNFSQENEKEAKNKWLKENLKCKYKLILNKEGITKSLFVTGKTDILVDDTLRNLAEWHKAGGTQVAYQYVTCEKGRRSLLDFIVENSAK